MSILPTTRSHRRATVLAAALALVGAGVTASNLANAGSGPSVLDYSQCQNGAPGSTPVPDCAWINGILNATASQYHEDQVTAQRLTISFPDKPNTTRTHTVTLNYLDRKGGIHAYDSLATVNTTMSDAVALRCNGIANICPGGSASTTDIPDDTNSVGPAGTGISKVVSQHQLPGQQLMLWGGTFASSTGQMTVPTHDNNATDTGDDYASTTITFSTPAGNGPHTIQLLFGGHLAPSAQTRGWGTGLGAASVSGGPYHIKLAAVDGASAGNRDNQIMSNAIIPIVAQGVGIDTTPSPDSPATIDTIGNTSDSATVTVADGAHPPTGSVTFDLYGPFSTQPVQPAPGGSVVCVDPPAVGENQITELTDTTYTTTATATQFTFSSGDYDLGSDATNLAVGWYQWVAHYVPGSDQYNLAFDGNCWTAGEQLHVTQANPTGTSVQTIYDTVTVSDGFSPSGSVSFFAYKALADCQADVGNDATTASGYVFKSADRSIDSTTHEAVSEEYTPDNTTDGTAFWWRVYYNGDTNNAAGDIEGCGTQTFSITNG